MTNLYDLTPHIQKALPKHFEHVSVIFSYSSREIDRRRAYATKQLLIDHVKYPALILDVGVGYGVSAGQAARLGHIVHGYDIDFYQLILSTLHLNYLLGKPFKTFLGDIGNDDIPKWFYDCLISTETLEHVLNEMVALKNMYDALRHEGIMILGVPLNDDEIDSTSRIIEVGLKDETLKYEVWGHLRSYTLEDVKEKMGKVGFEIIGDMTVAGKGRPDEEKIWTSGFVVGIKNEI